MLLSNKFRSHDVVLALQRGILGAVVAISMTAPNAVWAQHGHRGGAFGMLMGNPDRIAHKVDHVLKHLNATDAQHTQIKKIVQAAATDLKKQREEGRSLRTRAMELFAQTNVDANAVEALRQQMLQQLDYSSRRLTKAMLDTSLVLTPEQRVELAEQMKRRHEGKKRHWGRN